MLPKPWMVLFTFVRMELPEICAFKPPVLSVRIIVPPPVRVVSASRKRRERLPVELRVDVTAIGDRALDVGIGVVVVQVGPVQGQVTQKNTLTPQSVNKSTIGRT